jgi:uncharacterized RDD family membrane protein YckC
VPDQGPYARAQPRVPTRPSSPPTNPYADAQRPPGYGAAAAALSPYGGPPAAGHPYAPGVTATTPDRPGSLPFVEAQFGPVAGFRERVVAFLIDLAVTLGGFIMVLLGLLVVALSSGGIVTFDNGARVASGGDTVLTRVGVLLFVLGYHTIVGLWVWNRVFMMGRTGRSVGKRARGLKLVDATTGDPIGASKAFARDLVQGFANLVFCLGYLWMLWDKNKQTLGDKAVGSAVIHRPAAADGEDDDD